MSRTVYVNGNFVDEKDACVSVFDRAFLFADAVYEVSAVLGGALVDNAAHLARLRRSLGELGSPRACLAFVRGDRKTARSAHAFAAASRWRGNARALAPKPR